MITFHVWFVPLITFVVMKLLWNKHMKDAILFFVLSLAGYGLWRGIVIHRPFIITIFIAKLIESMKMWAN